MRCEECGFEYGALALDDVSPRLRELAARYAGALTDAEPADLRRRPAPDVWSALEYACHLRDVALVMRERVLQVLREPAPPTFTPMGRDERVVHDRYLEQAPDDVARQLVDAVAMLTFVLDGLDDDQWSRTCTYNYPTPTERSLRWVAVHTVHEAEHHLVDLTTSLSAARRGT